MKTTISDKNSKIGKIPNVSLPPVLSCGKDVPCKAGCYALKAFRMYPSVKSAWGGNMEMVENNINQYFADIDAHLSSKKKPVPFFRWHVSGDIVSNDYLKGMIRIAKMFPFTTFLAFTKRYDIVNSCEIAIPGNLTIIFSAWPGYPMNNPKCFPVAYMQDGTETRVPADAINCPGNCEMCGMCFNLPKIGKDVVFIKH